MTKINYTLSANNKDYMRGNSSYMRSKLRCLSFLSWGNEAKFTAKQYPNMNDGRPMIMLYISKYVLILMTLY